MASAPADTAVTGAEGALTDPKKPAPGSVPKALAATMLPPPCELRSLVSLTLRDCGLTEVPEGIAAAVSLKQLDVGKNPLTDLPAALADLNALEILFASGCPQLRHVPEVLGSMPALTRLGLRNNAISEVSAAAIPPRVQHLILTDNEIRELHPDVFRRLTCVRKLMLSHNKLTAMPEEGIACLDSLELLRLSNNAITHLPPQLFRLPRLTWLAVSGNPLPGLNSPPPCTVPTLSLARGDVVVDDGPPLGSGASGVVHAAEWDGRPVAVKLFKAVTSDGKAEEEVKLYGAVGSGNPHVAACVAVIDDTADGGGLGVVMDRLPAAMRDLALPPTIVEVTADRYADGVRFALPFVRRVLTAIADALAYLHGGLRIAHGDVYAHNILVNDDGLAYLLDFGASWAYGGPGSDVDPALVERLEVRAFGVLASELAARLAASGGGSGESSVLADVIAACLNSDVAARPSFADVQRMLGKEATWGVEEEA